MKLRTAKGSDLAGGGQQYMDKPGMYHLLVENFHEGLNSKGETLEGSTIECKCLGGEHADQVNRNCNLTLWDIDLSKPAEDQKTKVACWTNFLLATNVIVPSQLDEDIEFDPKMSIQHQFIAKLCHPRKKVDGKWVEDTESKFLQFAFSDIFHVDDPAVANVPKSLDAISFIPSDHRHVGPQAKSWFSYKGKESVVVVAAGKSSDFDDDDDF